MAGLIDFEQKSLLCTTPPNPPPLSLSTFLDLVFELHPTLKTLTSSLLPFLRRTKSLRPLNSIQPPLLEHPRPPRIQPPNALVPTFPPQPPIRMLLARHLHLPPRPLSRLPIRTRSATPTTAPILSPAHTGIYPVSDRKHLGGE